MEKHKVFLNVANSLVTMIVVLFLVICGLYSGYSLWDNYQVYAEVDDIKNDLLKIKPDADDPSFEELLAINSDVCGWITLDNTEIDYPILQGEDNLSYINTDVYGDFALSGSIFLDSSCDRNFNGMYSLLYGHHMANHKMFGDLDLYRDIDFFNENGTGTLILTDRSYSLNVLAVMQVNASESNIFSTLQWQSDTSGLREFVRNNNEHFKDEVVADIETNNYQILAMSTCSSDFTDARTVVIAEMKPYTE